MRVTFLKCTLVACCFVVTAWSPAISAEAKEDAAIDVGQMQRTILEQQAILAQAQGQDIVVVLGNTGSGKSTLINLLAEVPLRLDSSAHIVVDAVAGLKVEPGIHSITKHPAFLRTKAGMIWDCPGFNDTEGAISDCITAALIRELLTKARTVKVVLVTSGPEIEAARGATFKALLKASGMFSKQFLEASGLITVNMVDRESIDGQDWLQSVVGDAAEARRLGSLCKEAIPFRRTRVADKINVLFEDRDNLTRAIMGIAGLPVPVVNISLAFGVETTEALLSMFTSVAQRTHIDHQQNIYKQALGAKRMNGANLGAAHESCWRVFRQFVERDPCYKLLQPLATAQEERALNKFKEIFIREHAAQVQALQLRERDEILRVRDAEIQRLNIASAASERLLREENSKAAALKKETEAAQARVREALQEAERSKGISEQEKRARADALQQAKDAVREKVRLDQEIVASRSRIDQQTREHSQAIAQINAAKQRLDSQLQQMHREQESRTQSFQRELQELRIQNSTMRELQEQARQQQAQIQGLNQRILAAQGNINATNQRIAERNQRIAQRGGRHHGRHGGGHGRAVWPAIPQI